MGDQDEELRAEVERLRAENKDLKAGAARERYLKVSAKGGVSLYGIRRFPVTFYADEWDTILGMADDIRAFISQNEDGLKQKK